MSTNVMKSLRFAGFGPPSVLRIEEVAIPEPGEGEALVHVKAAAINPSDIGNVAGHFKSTTLPRTPGRDFWQVAGTASFTPQLLNFLKNTAMVGGLLFIAATKSQPTLLPRTSRSNGWE
jgi:hypothetical protein